MNISKLAAMFVQGMVIGSGPCFVLCAPIVLPFLAGTQRSVAEGIWSIIEFSIGRIIVYSILGGLFGYFGYWLYRMLVDPKIISIIWIMVSLYLVILGIILALGRDAGFKFCRAHSGENLIMLGILVGLSPCFPLLAIMTEISLFSKGAGMGMIYAFTFGLGTIVSPLIILGAVIPLVPGFILRGEKARSAFARLCGIALVLIGAYFMFKYR